MAIEIGRRSLERDLCPSADELEKILAAPPDGLCVLDVREPWEHLLTPWPPATHRIPFAELPSRRSEVPAGGDMIIVCSIGERSADAVRLFKDHGCTSVRHLKNGLRDFLP